VRKQDGADSKQIYGTLVAFLQNIFPPSSGLEGKLRRASCTIRS
jgi:hypothetical protein